MIDMADWALLVLRFILGALLAGHGAQKLFGWFGGYGLEGTSVFMESLGLRPGRPWAILAGLSEFVGGLLVLFGFLNPIGPLAIIGTMIMATVKAHWGKPIWVTSGGAELPIAYMAMAAALILVGPGNYSLDRALGIQMPGWVVLAVLVVMALILALGITGIAQPRQAQKWQSQERQAA